MKQVVTIEELRAERAKLKDKVGFVPTMGFLHAGHISLVRLAKEDCDSVVVSIFINPTQFGPNEDLGAYPRDIPADLAKLEAAGVDLVWLPDSEVMYTQGFNTWVDVEGVSAPLEGARRPGHFRGVATVVAKLFNAVGPDKAYFGQKDAQQVAVLKQMVTRSQFPAGARSQDPSCAKRTDSPCPAATHIWTQSSARRLLCCIGRFWRPRLPMLLPSGAASSCAKPCWIRWRLNRWRKRNMSRVPTRSR